MVKYNYFDALESLSDGAYNATLFACSENSVNTKKKISEIRADADDTLFSIENALFADFLPPLERDDIAAYAHTLSNVIDSAAEHSAISRADRRIRRKTEQELICIEIAKEIKENTAALKGLRNQSDIPDIQKFRQLLRSGFDSHASDLSKLSVGNNISTHAHILLSAGRLRETLSRCYDTLLEVMLNNI